MIYKKIKLLNFKQFVGEHEVSFSDELTIIVGENGSGKTNLLDAIKWCFYGYSKYTERSYYTNVQSLQLLENRKLHQTITTCVEIDVGLNNGFFKFIRKQIIDLKDDIKTVVSVFEKINDSYIEIQGFDSFVGRILPGELSNCFLWNAELSDKLNVKNTIKDLANLTIHERANTYLTMANKTEFDREKLSTNFLMERLREHLSVILTDTFSKISDRYYVIINKDFEICFECNYGGRRRVFEIASGEKLLSSFAFTASVLSVCREKYNPNSILFKGGIYPWILDSPFGMLNNNCRDRLFTYILTDTQQKVLLISPSQFTETIKEYCNNKGNYYQLNFNYSEAKDYHLNSPYCVRSTKTYEYSSISMLKI